MSPEQRAAHERNEQTIGVEYGDSPDGVMDKVTEALAKMGIVVTACDTDALADYGGIKYTFRREA